MQQCTRTDRSGPHRCSAVAIRVHPWHSYSAADRSDVTTSSTGCSPRPRASRTVPAGRSAPIPRPRALGETYSRLTTAVFSGPLPVRPLQRPGAASSGRAGPGRGRRVRRGRRRAVPPTRPGIRRARANPRGPRASRPGSRHSRGPRPVRGHTRRGRRWRGVGRRCVHGSPAQPITGPAHGHPVLAGGRADGEPPLPPPVRPGREGRPSVRHAVSPGGRAPVGTGHGHRATRRTRVVAALRQVAPPPPGPWDGSPVQSCADAAPSSSLMCVVASRNSGRARVST